MKMKIVADMNMPALEETFGLHGELLCLEGRSIEHADLLDADVLLVRAVTRVNADLLQGTAVGFVGSATIGIDHLNTDWLENHGIVWAHAPGCNADAAAQYTLAMMWLACQRLNQEFRQQRVGIIGWGNVGRRLGQLLRTLDIPVMACDPPLADMGEPKLVSMAEVCANSIISLHLPLTQTGRYPSQDLFDLDRLTALQQGTLLVNAARGGVVEKQALFSALRSGQIYAALDVWPEEPYIKSELLDAVTVATPHIAGYSREGKQAGTEMIYRAFCSAFSLKTRGLPMTVSDLVIVDDPASASPDQLLQRLLESSCPVARDDAALRALPPMSGDQDHIQIDSLRNSYPDRREFKSHRVTGTSGDQAHRLSNLGFKTG